MRFTTRVYHCNSDQAFAWTPNLWCGLAWEMVQQESTTKIFWCASRLPCTCNCILASLPLIHVVENSKRPMELSIVLELSVICINEFLARREVFNASQPFYFTLEITIWLPSFLFRFFTACGNKGLQRISLENLFYGIDLDSGKLHYLTKMMQYKSPLVTYTASFWSGSASNFLFTII